VQSRRRGVVAISDWDDRKKAQRAEKESLGSGVAEGAKATRSRSERRGVAV